MTNFVEKKKIFDDHYKIQAKSRIDTSLNNTKDYTGSETKRQVPYIVNFSWRIRFCLLILGFETFY